MSDRAFGVRGTDAVKELQHAKGRVEDRLHAAVVLLELQHARIGKVLRKIQDVVNGGSAERINALRVVANDAQAAAARAERFENRRLQRIGVLIFIDEHGIE